MLRHYRNRGSRSTESANPARPIWVKSAILLGVAARSQLIIAPGRLPLTAICIRGEEKVRTQFLSPTNIRIRCPKAENVRLQFLSLRQFFQAQFSPHAFLRLEIGNNPGLSK